MQLFFTSHTEGNKAFLDAEETRHCKVLRKNAGDVLQVLDGKGLLMECRITAIRKDSAELEMLHSSLHPRQRPYYFHLYIAPTKQNERMEWMLEKCIEAGLDEITFIGTGHSEKTRINMPRLEKIAVSALKQSGQYYLPKINPLTGLDEIQVTAGFLVAHCGPGEKASLMHAVHPLNNDSRVSVMIGPEGDFSDQEVKSFLEKGARAISLGKSRLRTETAGLYCSVMLNGLSADL
jgi:16S rRNA (uracil1498-N3)-methyltransferase